MANRLVVTNVDDMLISTLYDDKGAIEINVENDDNILNNIYIAKVNSVVKNINAAFVDIANGVNCYYSLDANKNHLFVNEKKNNFIKPGDEILVQVEKENIKTKAPVVTSNFSIPGKYLVLTRGNNAIGLSNKIADRSIREEIKKVMEEYVTEEYGFIVRTNAENTSVESIRDEAIRLIEEYDRIISIYKTRSCYSLIYKSESSYVSTVKNQYMNDLNKIVTDDKKVYDDISDYLRGTIDEAKVEYYEDDLLPLSKLYSVETELKNALSKKVWLKSGGYLIIEPTEALTVIDVNTGKSVSKKDQRETFLRINIEAAKEIAKQLRLRNMSGIIIVDFIDMIHEEDKEKLMNYIRNIIKNDPVKTNLVDITALNLVEITRKKIKKPLHEQVRQGNR